MYTAQATHGPDLVGETEEDVRAQIDSMGWTSTFMIHDFLLCELRNGDCYVLKCKEPSQGFRNESQRVLDFMKADRVHNCARAIGMMGWEHPMREEVIAAALKELAFWYTI